MFTKTGKVSWYNYVVTGYSHYVVWQGNHYVLNALSKKLCGLYTGVASSKNIKGYFNRGYSEVRVVTISQWLAGKHRHNVTCYYPF